MSLVMSSESDRTPGRPSGPRTAVTTQIATRRAPATITSHNPTSPGRVQTSTAPVTVSTPAGIARSLPIRVVCSMLVADEGSISHPGKEGVMNGLDRPDEADHEPR